MNAEQVRVLPAVLDVPAAAELLGFSRNAAYDLIRSGGWPTPVLRLGRLIKIPTAPLLQLLGIADLPAPPTDWDAR